MTSEPTSTGAETFVSAFTSDPSAWVIESYPEPAPGADEVEPETCVIKVADTAAFVSALTAAGLRVTVRRFLGEPAGEVGYIGVDSGAVSFHLRKPNRGEVERAFCGPVAEPAGELVEPVRVGYPVRVLPDPTSPAQLYGPNGFRGATGIVMRRGADGWAGEGNAPAESWLVRLDSVPDSARPRLARDNIARFPGRFLEVIGEVSQNNADPYPCANCHGRGRTKLAPLDPCIRCGGSGSDPYVNRGLSDRASRELDAAPVIHDLDGSGTGAHAADCSGCAVEPAGEVEHEHYFPLPPNAETDPSMEPADCACGMTYVEYDAQMGERIADELERMHASEPAHTITGNEDARFDVAIYFGDGRAPERHEDVSAARARELEQTFTASPAIERIDVTPRAGESSEIEPAGGDTRADDALWLVQGYDPSPCRLGCPHRVSQHRRDVGCAFCDCTYGRPES